MFVVVVFALWFALHGLAAFRLVRPLAGKRRRRVLYATVVALAVLPPAALVLERAQVDGAHRHGLTYAGFVLAGFSTVTLLLLLARDGAWIAAGAGMFVRRRLRARREAAAPAPDLARRAFLLRASNAGVVGVSAATFGAGMAFGAAVPRAKTVEILLPDLPPGLDGFRIAQLTDVHIGPVQSDDYLRACVEATNALSPDLVAVTGDLVDGFVPALRDSVRPLADLRARHGAWFVTGNHEFYWDAPAWCDELRRLGLTVLENEHRVLEHEGARLVVAGVHDRSGPKQRPPRASDPAAALRGAPAEAFKLMLAHQPNSVYAACKAGAQVQLSGHTHGGQFFPITVLLPLLQRYVAGLYRHRPKGGGGETALYVSRGTGSWGPPLRLGSPKEISLIVLRRG